MLISVGNLIGVGGMYIFDSWRYQAL